MMVIAFGVLILVLGAWIGYQYGYEKGKLALETDILHHVTESDEYADAVVEAFRKAFNKRVRGR